MGVADLPIGCGALHREAKVSTDSEYDPWSNSNVVITNDGRTLEFINIHLWESGAITAPKVTGSFDVWLEGMGPMPGFNLPFEIQVIDCTLATMTTPGTRNPQTVVFDGNSFEMKVSIADFAFSEPLCQIDHYLITCTDFNSKTKISKCTK